MGRIFIGYAHEDAEVVNELVAFLRSGRFDVTLDENMPAGKVLSPIVTEQINAAHCVVVMWSRNAIGSSWVPNEASLAFEQGKYLPVFLDDVEEAALPLPLHNIKYVNLNGWDGDLLHKELRHLIIGIKEIIRRNEGPAGGIQAWKHVQAAEHARLAVPDVIHVDADTVSIGVHVGSTRIAVGKVRISKDNTLDYWPGRIVRREHDAITNVDEVIKKIKSSVDELLDLEELGRDDIKGIGIAWPGQINRKTGFLRKAPGLQIDDKDLCALLRDDFYCNRVPVHFDNDINCAAFAELTFGCGSLYNDFVCVFRVRYRSWNCHKP